MNKWLLSLLLCKVLLVQVYAQRGDSIAFFRNWEAAQNHLYTNKDSAFFYLDAALLIACEENWTRKAVAVALEKATGAFMHADLDALYESLLLVDGELSSPPRDSVEKEFFLNREQLWGVYYKSVGDLGRATHHFSRIIQYLEAEPEKSLSDYGWLNSTYQWVGEIHKASGRYDEALECFFHSRSHETAKAFLTGEEPNYKHHHIHIAKLYRLKGDLSKAHYYYREAEKAFERAYNDNPGRRGVLKNSMISLYLNLAGLYRDEGQPDSALAMIDKAIAYHDKNDPFYDDTYVVLGHIYSAQERYAEAVLTFERSFQLRKKRGRNTKNYEAGMVLSAIGEVYEKQNDLDSALRYYQRALAYLSESFNSLKLSDNPPLDDRIGPHNALLEVLNRKSQALYKAAVAGNGPGQNRREWAWNTTLLAIRLIDTARVDCGFDYDKMALLDHSYSAYELAIRLAYEKGGGYWEKAFELAEKSKAVLLYEAVKSTQAETFAGIEEEHRQELSRLRAELVQLNNRLASASEEEVEALRSERYKVGQEYQNLMTFFQSEYPEYYRLKYGLSTVSPQRVQEELLRPGQAFIEYFVGKEDAYAFWISGDCTLQMKKLDWSERATEAALSIRDDIYRMNDGAYIRKGRLLYDLLLAPVLEECPAEDLVIIPDGLLGYIPFDALLTRDIPSGERANYRSFPYLVTKATLSQSFSATMLYEMYQGALEPGGKRLGLYAPAYHRINSSGPIASLRSLLDTLLYNEVEAEGIRQILGGTLVSNRRAVKAHFLEHAAGYKALHISAHAKVDDRAPNYSFIAFSNLGDTLAEPYKLYVHELYNMRLPVAMAVLSACETGVGQSRRGEGIISIARAFSYAGAQSIITTLWNIDDKQSKELMLHFYRNLGMGQRKDIALSAAKRAYLAAAPDQERAHPLYWASFVAIGNMDVLELSRLPGWGFWMLCGAITILVVTLGLMMIRRKRG